VKLKKIPDDFTREIKITSFDADCRLNLRLSAALRFQQEAGDGHLSEGGLDHTVLRKKGLVFVISRAFVWVNRLPRYGETVRLTTWSRGIIGSQFFRCYRFTDMDGGILMDNMSAFAPVDPDSHKLLRPFAAEWLVLPHLRDRECGPQPEKIKLPEKMPENAKRKIKFSDIDCNGHMNNAVYADIVCDHLPDSFYCRTVKSLTLNFKNEALWGDELVLAGCEEENAVYISGRYERGECFAAKMEFNKKKDAKK